MLLSSIFSRSRLRRASTSLAVQILALFLITTLVPLVVGFVQSRDDFLAAERRATESALSVADNAAGDIEGITQFARQAGKAISTLPAFWNGTDAERDQLPRPQSAMQFVRFLRGDFTFGRHSSSFSKQCHTLAWLQARANHRN